MKFTALILSLTIAISDAKTRRHLNTIKGDESDASMSYLLSPARGGSSKSKSAPTGAPTGSPTSATPIEPGECGSVINTGEVFTLQESLKCDCSDDPALTVDGRGTVLNLNGYTVDCKRNSRFPNRAIEVLGTGNTVMGPGTAARFATFGIKLSSGGFHTVNGVTIGSVGNGILIESNDNTIINNFIIDSDLDGVIFDGTDRNMIKGNTIIDSRRAVRNDNNSNTGTSDDNHIISNTIISSGKDGMLVVGERNVIQGNTIDQSGDQGIVVGSSGGRTPPISEGVIIKDNSITNSNEYGITINDGTTNTVVIGNTIAGYTNGSIDNNGDGTAEADNIEVM